MRHTPFLKLLDTHELQDGLVFGKSLQSKPPTQVFQDGSVREVITCFVSLKNDLEYIVRLIPGCKGKGIRIAIS